VELAAEYRPGTAFRLRSSYAFFDGDLSNPVEGQFIDLRKDPRHQVSVWSQFNLPNDLEFDVIGRWVSGLRGRFQQINGYFGLNARLAWRPSADWEIALVGQNLANPQHLEYVEDTGIRGAVTAVPRGGYLQVSRRF
jgi:outer membrane receptor protein involved in Fe transport